MTTPKVTYILGAGRSGSTVLERLLSSAPGVVGIGEVATLWRRPLRTLTCSCGAPALDCPFWIDVRLKASLSDDILSELAALESSFIRHRQILADALQGQCWSARPGVRRFAAHQAALFSAIAEATGASRIIDSSKAGPRAWALADMIGVSIVHLRRNPSDVAASWRRIKHDPSLKGPMRRPSFPTIACDWLTVEISARRLGVIRPVLRLNYEALVEDPKVALQRLGPIASGVRITGRSFAPDPSYHSLNGNPDRFTRGAITLQSVAAPALPRRDAAFARLTGAALNLAAP